MDVVWWSQRNLKGLSGKGGEDMDLKNDYPAKLRNCIVYKNMSIMEQASLFPQGWKHVSTADFPEFEMFTLSKDYMEVLGRETENLFRINRKAEGKDRYFEWHST